MRLNARIVLDDITGGLYGAISAAVGLTGCQKQTQQLRLLSDQEASDIWNKAVAYEPVGGPVVKQLPDETGACTNVVTNQVYMLTMPGGGRTQIMVGCGGGCKTDGGPLQDLRMSLERKILHATEMLGQLHRVECM
jgi:hypothetical protein